MTVGLLVTLGFAILILSFALSPERSAADKKFLLSLAIALTLFGIGGSSFLSYRYTRSEERSHEIEDKYGYIHVTANAFGDEVEVTSTDGKRCKGTYKNGDLIISPYTFDCLQVVAPIAK